MNTVNSRSGQIDLEPFGVTFFVDRRGLAKSEAQLTLRQLFDEIRETSATDKARLPLLKLARFGETVSAKGSYRTDANMLHVSGIEAEHDAGRVSFKAACAVIRSAGLRAILYTTPSHKPIEHEKWRILLPLTDPVLPGARRQLVARLNALFDGQLAPESFVASQSYYYGSVSDSFRIVLLDGDCLDRRPDLTAERGPERITVTKSGASQIKALKTADYEEILRKAGARDEEGWYEAMRHMTAHFAALGWDAEAIAERLGSYCREGEDDTEMWVFIKSAVEKYGPKPPPDMSFLKDLISKTVPQFERTQQGGVRICMTNARLAIAGVDLHCSHDTFHNRIWVGRNAAGAPIDPVPNYIGEVSDGLIRALRVHLHKAFRVDFTEKHTRDAVLSLAEENRFDPICDMLAEAQANWDGKRRIDRLAADYFHCADTELNRQCFRKTMVAAVARARQPGCKFDTILVTEAVEGHGKSTAWLILAGGQENFSDETLLGKNTREVQEHMAGKWICEIAELAGMRKADVEMVKAFASRQVDRARPAYGHFIVEQPRHGIVVGTTNAMNNSLISQTGNRRFWPVKCEASIELARLKADRLQLWGEAAAYQAQGERLELDEWLWEAASVEQELRRVIDPWEHILDSLCLKPTTGPLANADVKGCAIAQEDGNGTQFVSSADILKHALGLSSAQMDYVAGRRLATVMARLGWTPSRSRVGGERVRGYCRNNPNWEIIRTKQE